MAEGRWAGSAGHRPLQSAGAQITAYRLQCRDRHKRSRVRRTGGCHAGDTPYRRGPGQDRRSLRVPPQSGGSPVVRRSRGQPPGLLRRGRTAVRGSPPETAAARLSMAGRGRQRTWRLVRHHRDHGARGRPPGRAPGRGQGQHRGGRGADDERFRHGGRVHPGPRCHRGQQAARRGRHHHWQGGLRGPVLLRRQPHLPDRARAQPMGPVQDRGRLVQWQRRAGRRRARRHGSRRGPGRVDPHPQRVLRDGRAQAHPRARALHRRVPHREHARPPRVPSPAPSPTPR